MLTIIYEDEDLVVINKPAGRIVHPAPGHLSGSITEELVSRFPEMAKVGSVERPGVVHRLDVETSGVMVFARTQAAYHKLRKQFEAHTTIKKTYLAVLHGAPKEREGTLDGPVGRDHLRAITHWQVLTKHGPIALVEFNIETGRMHQIRIHAAELGSPVVGDKLYGNREKDRALRIKPRRQLLHAAAIEFVHPRTNKKVRFVAEIPPDIVYAG